MTTRGDQALDDLVVMVEDQNAAISALIEAVLALREAFSITVPAPQVHVPPANEIVPLDVGELAAAIVNALPQTPDVSEPLGELTAKIGDLLTSMREQKEPKVRAVGELSRVGVLNASGQRINPATTQDLATLATEATLDSARDHLADLKRGLTDQQNRFDYGARTDSNPVYAGWADQGTATSAATWTIRRFTYDSSNRATDIQTLVGAWDDRASLSWV